MISGGIKLINFLNPFNIRSDIRRRFLITPISQVQHYLTAPLIETKLLNTILLGIQCDMIWKIINKWFNQFKNGSDKTCGRQPLKNLKRYGPPKQTISVQFF